MNALFEGYIDFSVILDYEYLDLIEGEPSLTLIQGKSSPVGDWMPINTLTVDLPIRKAMNYAFDYPYMLEEIGQNYRIRSDSLLSSENRYYNQSIGVPDYNLTYAREVLIDAGKAPPEALTWTDQDWKDVATSGSPIDTIDYLIYDYDNPHLALLRENMKLIGIEIFDKFEGEAEWSEILMDVERRKTEMETAIAGHGCPLVDPTRGWLDATFKTNGTFNLASLSDPLIDQWIDEAAIELDPEITQEIVNKICNRIQNELYTNIYLSHTVGYIAMSADWEGYVSPYGATLFYFMHEISPGSNNGDDNTDNEITIDGYPFFGLNFMIVVTMTIIIFKSSKRKNLKIEISTRDF